MSRQTGKITLSFADLHSPQVEARVRQQAALASAQHSSKKASALPSRLPVPEAGSGSIWYNTFFNLTVFGLLGGLLAWGCGELVQYLNPDLQAEARALDRDIGNTLFAARNIGSERAAQLIQLLEERGNSNPWFRIRHDKKLTDAQRGAALQRLATQEQLRNLLADVFFYCACGTMIAISLGMAESVAARNMQGAVVYGAVGALLGLVGGVAVALFIEQLYHRLGGGSADAGVSGSQVAARALSWGVLGLFLSAAPGVVMRNSRKLLFGLIGGFAGGAVGGVLFDTVGKYSGNPVISRLIAIVSIGLVTGIGTALVENAAKQGWLKVIRGLIAGKQFIVYRNPTFIGSSPACEIYLFKDAKVGRRHAALHILPTGYMIEDLGTGAGTFINGRQVSRSRLRGGDQLQIGSTCFNFQERVRK